MSYFLPTWYLDHDQMRGYQNHAKKALTIQALNYGLGGKYAGPIEGAPVDIVDLLPKHLGISSWDLPICPKGEIVPWFNIEIPADIVIAIYKVVQLTINPKIDQIILQHAGVNFPYELSQLIIYGHEGYISEPHVLTPGATLKVSIGSQRGAKQGHRLLLGGLVARHLD
jgi:hypothetical protein